MRNDARPIGEDRLHSALRNPPSGDARESETHDRQSPIVNQAAEKDAQRDDHDIEPLPTGDPTPNRKI